MPPGHWVYGGSDFYKGNFIPEDSCQIAAIFIGGILMPLAVPQYRTRLATVPSAMGIFSGSTVGQEEPDGAILGRATEMLAAGRIAVDHPILGVGPNLSETYTREYSRVGGLRDLQGVRQSHCMFLEIPAETGIPGMFLFLGMLVTSIRVMLRSRKQVMGNLCLPFRLHHHHAVRAAVRGFFKRPVVAVSRLFPECSRWIQ